MKVGKRGEWLNLTTAMFPMARVFFFCIIIGLPFDLAAQDDDAITARIIDVNSGVAVPFATIKFGTDRGYFGVISNGNGDFRIPGMYRQVIDSIKISCIGYITKAVPLNQLQEGILNVIKLQESVTQLSEVVVKGKRIGGVTAYKIVQAAIDAIPKNYPVSDNSYIGYYRDYQIRNSSYVNLNEAIVGVFDKGFNANDQLTTRISLYDYKKNNRFQRDSAIETAYDNTTEGKFIPGAVLHPFGGNELSILRIHDAIRNRRSFSYSYVNQFDKDFLDNHFFKLEPTVLLNQTRLYHISFKAKTTITQTDHSASGELYIEYGSFAIHKLEYSVFANQNGEKRNLYNIHVEYTKSDPGMRLNYISFNNFFRIRDPKDFRVVDVLLDRHLNAFVIEFNRAPETGSALDARNYQFRYYGKKLEILEAKIREKGDNHVYVYLVTPIPPSENNSTVGQNLKADFKNIRDMHGREVNEVTYLEVNQFRELFVQQTTECPDTAEKSYVDRNVPLSKSVISADVNLGNYWMNTPLKKE